MYEHRSSVEKSQTLLFLLTDIETLLTLVVILPMLHAMNNLVNIAQSHTLYTVEYTRERKLTCLTLDNLYIMVESFTCLTFTNWSKIINIENDDFFLKFDIKKRDAMYGSVWEYGSLLL